MFYLNPFALLKAASNSEVDLTVSALAPILLHELQNQQIEIRSSS